MNYWRDYCKDDDLKVSIVDDATVEQRLPKCIVCAEKLINSDALICSKCRNAILYARVLMEDDESRGFKD